MSRILIAFALSLSFIVSDATAQGRMTPPEFDAEKAAGIFIYDLDKVVKKLKITDEESQLKVAEHLKAYNTKMDELSFEHASTFQELEDTFDKNVQIAMQNRDRSQMNGVKAQIQSIIPPIRKQVVAEEQVLNEAMANILTEKQNKKWLKYQKRQRE